MCSALTLPQWQVYVGAPLAPKHTVPTRPHSDKQPSTQKEV